MKRVLAALDPRAWSVTLKLTALVLAAALLPLAVVGFVSVDRSLDSSRELEDRNLELLASITAARIDQLLNDTRADLSLVRSSPPVRALLATGEDRAGAREAIGAIVEADPDLANVLLLDRRGRGVLSTDRALEGNSYAFRPYYRDAIRGRAVTTDVLVAVPIDVPVVVFAGPVRDARGEIVGVAVVALKASSIGAIVEAASVGDGGWAVLLDRFGIVISSRFRRALYHSLVPLPPATRRELVEERQFPARDIRPLGEATLAAAVEGARGAGTVDYTSAVDGEEKIAGFAPLRSQRWTVVVNESEERFAAPLDDLRDDILLAALIVAIVALGLALALARAILSPVRRLTRAAERLERGEYDPAGDDLAPAARSRDDLGRLARVFARMASEVTARQRDLEHQVRELRIEIDEARRREQVQRITETDYFRDLQRKARAMRADKQD